MKNRLVRISIICLIMILVLTSNLYARVSSTDPTTTSGGEVTITLKSAETIYACKVKLNDSNGLTFVSATSSAGQVNGKEINGASTSGFNTIGTYKFKVPEVTKDTKYTVKFDVSVSKDGETYENVVNSSTVTVKAKETSKPSETTTNQEPSTKTDTTKSSNANLSTLGVTPKEYDFTGFAKTKTEYSVTVPSSVDKLNVLYKTEDSKAKAVVTGNTDLKVGSDNNIVIKVTAEDGTTKEYTIKVTKLAEDEEKPGNVIDDGTELFLTKLEIEGIELSPEFDQKTLFYKAILNEDKDEVTVNAVANNEKAKVTISGNKNLKDGENTISIIVSLDGKVEQKVYQITLNKNLETESESETTTTGSTEVKGGMIGNVERYIVVGIALIIFIILVIIVLICLIRREKKREVKYREEDDDDEIEVVPPLKTRLYNQDNNEEDYRKTIEEINAQTQSIFHKDEEVEGQSVEYEDDDDYLKEKRRGKGKH